MIFSEFFDFDSKLSSSTFQANAIDLKKDKNGIEEQWKLIDGSYSGIVFPVQFKYFSGDKLLDMLDTGWPSLYLISEKMIKVLNDNHLTGWKTFPIKIFDKNEEEIKGYQGFSITGRAGAVDYSKSEIVEKKLVREGPLKKYYKGIYIEIDSWDTSDFFLTRGSYGIYITKKAAEVLTNAKLTNLCIRNLSDIETTEFTVNLHQKKLFQH